MGTGKALSVDAFPDEALLGSYDEQTKQAMCQFIADVLNGKRRIPACLKEGKLVLLSKSGSEKVQVTQTRPLAVLPPALKAVEKMILPSLTEVVWSEVGEYQAGFRPGRSCHHNIV